MFKQYIITNYPETEILPDIVEFTSDREVSNNELRDRLYSERSRMYIEGLNNDRFDFVDKLMERVAKALGGEWKYITPVCYIDIWG